MQLIKSVNDINDGSLNYKKSVVFQIIELATKEIAGVASFAKSKYVNVKNAKVTRKHGLVVAFIDDGIIIDVFVNILFGYSVNDVAFKVQENVKRSVESMTDFKVKHINVHITGVLFENMEGKVIM